MSNAQLVAARASDMHDAAAAAVNPIIVILVKSLETFVLGLVQEPNAKALLQRLIDYINTLLGVSVAAAVQARCALHAEAAATGRPFIQMLIALIEKLLTGLAGNPAVLQAIIAFIMQILGGLPTPAPTP